MKLETTKRITISWQELREWAEQKAGSKLNQSSNSLEIDRFHPDALLAIPLAEVETTEVFEAP